MFDSLKRALKLREHKKSKKMRTLFLKTKAMIMSEDKQKSLKSFSELMKSKDNYNGY